MLPNIEELREYKDKTEQSAIEKQEQEIEYLLDEEEHIKEIRKKMVDAVATGYTHITVYTAPYVVVEYGKVASELYYLIAGKAKEIYVEKFKEKFKDTGLDVSVQYEGIRIGWGE